MSRLVIIGAGGHGKVVLDTALAMGSWREVEFADAQAPVPAHARVLEARVFPADDVSLGERLRGADFVVAIGRAAPRIAEAERGARLGGRLVTLVHPRASVSRFATLGAGTVVFANANISAAATLGELCIVNHNASVDHDTMLGRAVHVCPGASIAGNCDIGDGSWIGIGAAVREGTRIGAHVTIGAGGVVVADILTSGVYTGVPVRAVEGRSK